MPHYARHVILAHTMQKQKRRKRNLLYITGKFSVVFGLVLIWRGIWELLDAVDVWMFQGSHIWTALIGVLVGMAILYIPDNDLKEIDQH